MILHERSLKFTSQCTSHKRLKMLWWILFVVSVIFIYVKIWRPYQYWNERNVPFLKPDFPILGNMAKIFFRRSCFGEGMIELCKKSSSRYFGFYQFLKPILMVTDTEIIKKIGVKDFDSFLDHPPVMNEETEPLLSKNLFMLRGQKWRNMRSTLSPAFTSSKMRQMFILMSECADDFTSHFLKQSKLNENITIEMKDICTRFANDVIATCAFGFKCDSLGDRENEFFIMGKRATDFTAIRGLKFFGYLISPNLMQFFKVRMFDLDVADFFENLVTGTINAREKQGIIRPDMIHLLMEARKGKLKYEETTKNKEEDTGFATVEESHVGRDENNKIDANDITDEDVTAQIIIFFFAGFATTSNSMCHMANELAINPEIQERLQAEVDDALQKCNGKITYEAIARMKYMDMVVSETLRKWPPQIHTDRICTKTYTMQPSDPNQPSFTLNKNDLVAFPIFAIHRDPEYYPDPEKFDPERFSDENKKNIKPFTYIPFGFGPRNCIGSRFALLEIKTMFVHLLSKFSFVVDEKTQVPIKVFKYDFIMEPKNGFWLRLKARNK